MKVSLPENNLLQQNLFQFKILNKLYSNTNSLHKLFMMVMVNVYLLLMFNYTLSTTIIRNLLLTVHILPMLNISSIITSNLQ